MVSDPQHGINFAEYLLAKDVLQLRFNQWLRSLWFKPAGFFEEVTNATMQFLFVPYWLFDVQIEVQYRGQVCKLMATGSDPRGKKVEHWYEASGVRNAVYSNKFVCASADKDTRRLVKAFSSHWKFEKIHFAKKNNNQNNSALEKQQKEAAEEGWAGRFFKKLVTAVTIPEPEPPKPPPMEMLQPHLPWENVWKNYEKELVAMEQNECAKKLQSEHMALRVKDVKITFRVEVTRRLVYFPVCFTSYLYNGTSYKVAINGQTGQVNGDRPYGTGMLGELGKAGVNKLGEFIWKKPS